MKKFISNFDEKNKQTILWFHLRVFCIDVGVLVQNEKYKREK